MLPDKAGVEMEVAVIDERRAVRRPVAEQRI